MTKAIFGAGLAFSLAFGLSRGHAEPSVDGPWLESRILATALHEVQKPTRDWDPGQRDCAGFIRYIFRKSLGTQSRMWTDRQGQAVDFASAEHLLSNNFRFLARQVHENELRSGDVLAFYSPEKEAADRYHLMMVLRSPRGSLQRLLVIYHNGAAFPHGRVKRVWLDELAKWAGQEWAPVASNAHFQGVYRWQGW